MLLEGTCHRFATFCRFSPFSSFGWRDQCPMFAVGRNAAPIKKYMGGTMPNTLATLAGQAFTVRCLQFIADFTVAGKRQPLFRHGWPGNVAAQPFQYIALVGFGHHASVQGKACLFGHPIGVSGCVQAGWKALQECLYRNELPFRVEHQRLVKGLMIVEAGRDWTLRAKTGWDGRMGWWVGWVEWPGLLCTECRHTQ